jgi:hypothetical protein
MSASARRDFCIRWSVESEQQERKLDDFLDYNRKTKALLHEQPPDDITAHSAPCPVVWHNVGHHLGGANRREQPRARAVQGGPAVAPGKLVVKMGTSNVMT